MRVFLMILALLLAGALALFLWDRQSRELQTRYDPIIQDVTREYGIDPLLIRALIWRETRFNPMVVGHDDERGLMQVTPLVGQAWARAMKIDSYQVTDLFNPETNIRAGTWYLSRALRRWPDTDNPISFALAEYNAGRSNALRWVDPLSPGSSDAFKERIDYRSTKRYIEVIERKYQEYQTGYFRPPWMGYWERFIGSEKN